VPEEDDRRGGWGTGRPPQPPRQRRCPPVPIHGPTLVTKPRPMRRSVARAGNGARAGPWPWEKPPPPSHIIDDCSLPNPWGGPVGAGAVPLCEHHTVKCENVTNYLDASGACSLEAPLESGGRIFLLHQFADV